MMNSRFVKAFLIHCLVHLSMTLLVCGAFRAIFIQGIWNPFSLLTLLISNLLKPSWLVSVPFLFLNIALFSRVHVKSFSVHWWVPDRRLQYISRLIQPTTLAYCSLFMIANSWLLHQYVSLAYPKLPYLFLKCSERTTLCMNPSALLVVVTGLVFGFKFSLNYFANNLNVVKFSSSYPNLGTFLKAKLKMSAVLESSFSYGIGLELFGLIFGTDIMFACLVNELGMFEVLHVSHLETIWWNCLEALSDLYLLLSLVIALILLTFNLHMAFNIFDHVLTQRLEAPLPSTDVLPPTLEKSQETPWNLSNYLSSDSKLLQYLAFCQLKDMAIDTSPMGQLSRAQIFAISQPGGHPHNWQGVLKPSLNLVRKFTERLKRNNSFDEKDFALNGFASVGLHSQKAEAEAQSQTFCQKFVSKLKEYPLFCYLLLEIPDAAYRRIFAEALPVIWAVQGLAHLVAASFYDDTYGVVQKNITDILAALVDLQQIADKVGRGIPLRRGAHNDCILFVHHYQPQDLQLRKCLRMTLRSSIYAIADTFKESLREIPVSEEVATRLSSYLAFQEG